jgi:hypothetical protein
MWWKGCTNLHVAATRCVIWYFNFETEQLLMTTMSPRQIQTTTRMMAPMHLMTLTMMMVVTILTNTTVMMKMMVVATTLSNTMAR